VVAVNPTFSELSRAVRGYSLLALCALVATIVLVDDLLPAGELRPAFRRWSGGVYVVAVAIGVATHLFMVLVVVAHLVTLVGARRFDERWRQRFLFVAVLSALAYAGLARAMLDASGEHGTVFKGGLPVDVAEHILGSGWAAIVALPVALFGLVVALRSRVVRIGSVGFVVAFAFLWLLYRSSALTPRFFVFLVPVVGLLVAAAVGRVHLLGAVVVLSAVLALTSMVDGYRIDPTSYRQAADVIRAVDSTGGRSCVVDVGVLPMEAYADTPRDFSAVTDSGQLQSCDVVVVATWWHTDAEFYRTDRDIITAAEQRFPNQTVLGSDDPALVLSVAPLSRWGASV
jgi:hypothetical protein